MKLPMGTLDPISECERALKLGMSITELRRGRGAETTAHEMCVIWPLYDRFVAEEELRRQNARGQR